MPIITLREQTTQDALALAAWLSDPDAEWKRWDAPYFHAEESPPQVRGAAERAIVFEGRAIGLVTRHPERPAAGGWWELGILILNPQCWGLGLGTQALKGWVALTFLETGAHLLTFTTWSGNERMIRAGLRVGFRECARIPEARLYAGQRYDSVKLALLRRGWESANETEGTG